VTKPTQAASHVHGEFQAFVSLAGLIDVPAEVARLEKQAAEKTKAIQSAKAKLDNPAFTDKAPAEVVQEQRERLAELEKQLQNIQENLRDLKQG
jgi:valyl-tRNA synthetase